MDRICCKNELYDEFHYNLDCPFLYSQPQVIKVYQLLAHGRWFSPSTPASSTTKTGHRDIAEILLKVALNTIIQSINQSINQLKKIDSITTVDQIFLIEILVVYQKEIRYQAL